MSARAQNLIPVRLERVMHFSMPALARKSLGCEASNRWAYLNDRLAYLNDRLRFDNEADEAFASQPFGTACGRDDSASLGRTGSFRPA